MRKKIVAVLVVALVVLLSAIGIIKTVRHAKPNANNGSLSNGNSHTGTDDIYTGDELQAGIEIDFETGSVISEVGNTKPSSDNMPPNGLIVGEDNLPATGENTSAEGNNGNGDNSSVQGNNGNGNNSQNTSSNNNSNSSSSNTESSKPEQTPSDPNQQNMDGWTPFHP